MQKEIKEIDKSKEFELLIYKVILENLHQITMSEKSELAEKIAVVITDKYIIKERVRE